MASARCVCVCLTYICVPKIDMFFSDIYVRVPVDVVCWHIGISTLETGPLTFEGVPFKFVTGPQDPPLVPKSPRGDVPGGRV